MTAPPIAFVDLETTALDRDQLQVWEVALIRPEVTPAEPCPCVEEGARCNECDHTGELPEIVDWVEDVWHLPVDLSRADPMSLSMNGFVERYNDWDTPAEERPFKLWEFAREFALYTRGLTLVGANPAFDERALWKLLRDNGECPLWHYRTICVETLAAAYIAQLHPRDVPEARTVRTPPWKHTDLVRALGIDPDDFDRHSALGDARMAKAVWERVMGR